MRINIFGVGRSGTKAIQLYLSYLVALKEKKVWVNYEPYLWISRKGIHINHYGLECHLQTPFILSTEEKITDKKHLIFLDSLRDAPEGYSIITKFIRANGRIPQINKVLDPDYSIVVIRNLYEVIGSISEKDYTLFSVGHFPGAQNKHYEKSKEFLEEAHHKLLIDKNLYTFFSKRISNRTLKNSMYWYVMNKAAILSVPFEGKNIFIEYNSLQKELIFFQELFGAGPKVSLSSLPGKEIHTDKIIKDYFSNDTKIYTFPIQLKYRYNEKQFHSGKKAPFNIQSGSLVEISDFAPEHKMTSESKPGFHSEKYLQVQKSSLFDELQEEIDELLNKRINYQKKNLIH